MHKCIVKALIGNIVELYRARFFNTLKKIDFNQDDYETVEDYINAIIYDHNYLRPCYALNYKTPIEYRIQSGFN